MSRRTIGSSANQVAEHHRELPPLRGIGASAGSGFLTRRRLPRCSSPCKPRQDFELAPAMSIRPPRRSGGQTTRPRKPNRISRGTGSSNPVPSSRQSVSRGISPSCIEKSAVAAACAAPARRHGRQRRAGLVNITPIAGNVSAGRYSSTAVPARRFATLVALVRTARVGLAM